MLKKIFQAKPYLKKKGRLELARSLNLTERRVSKWYYKRRSLTKHAGLLNKPKGEEYSIKHAVIVRNILYSLFLMQVYIIPHTDLHTDIFKDIDTHTHTLTHTNTYIYTHMSMHAHAI